MRKIIYLFLVCVLILTGSVYALSSSSKDKVEEGIINLDSATLKYDLGILEKDKVAKQTVKIRNRLGRPIQIKSAESTCECISVSVKPQKVKRGGIFEVEITFDSKGLEANQYSEEVVYILTTDTDYELIRLVVLVEIVNPAG